MKLRTLHYYSGILLAGFILLHLTNHLIAMKGISAHIQFMENIRILYRNIVVESILLMAVMLQIFSGIKLYMQRKKEVDFFFEKLHLLSGLYLAFFLCIHVSAILAGRFILHLDTNFYFGAAGINTFPLMLFFVPYYALAILAVFGHIASIHAAKMRKNIFTLSPINQSQLILGLGFIVCFTIFYALTNHFQGIQLPVEYNVLIGR